MDNDTLVQQHRKEKTQSADFKERRLAQWNENNDLFRDKVFTNRLTQRQAVNIPIIRDTIQSWISKIDETPELKFETRGVGNDDRDRELVLNEVWTNFYDTNKLDILDNLEKKVVGLQGRAFKYLYMKDNRVKVSIIDPYDIDIDPRVNPLDLNTAQYFNHKHIFVPLRTVLANPTYSNTAKAELKHYLDSKHGLLEASRSDQEAQMRRERLENLGAHNYDDYRASDVMIELNRSHKLLWDKETGTFQRYLIVFAMDKVVLYKNKLKEAIGLDYLPYTTWASDPDINDIWSDGIADNVRTMNKVINMYFSQDLENRAYRNFGMYFYDTRNGTFTPRGFEAKPFGMYGVNGNPSEVLQQMRIEPLGDTQNAIEYFKNLIQSSVAQTPTERGVNEKNDQTLGEVQLSLQQSQTRQLVVAKQYRSAWKETGKIWYDLLNENTRGQFKLHKKNKDGDYQSKMVGKNDFYTPAGYECKVMLKQEKDESDDIELKKVAYVKNSFVNNQAAQKIAKRKELELIGWTPDEVDEVLQAEEVQQNQMLGAPVEGELPVEEPIQQ
ncbi:hypothetical protein KAU11_08315 [Candidatus Babeliales bacterium]|nr:hypothetical protein [Candidatus Babeliales bacterium]